MPLVLPICTICAKSGRLCRNCQIKLRNNEISQTDIDVSKILAMFTKQFPATKNLKINKIVETSQGIFIIVGKNQKVIFGDINDPSSLAAKVKKEATSNMVVLEKTKNSSKIVEELLLPIEPVQLTTLTIPPFGEEEIKVKLKKTDKENMPFNEDQINEVLKAVSNQHAYFIYV
ncbi:MAG: hypothetical protein KAR35_08215 [Candidatus Heimdallarchaeota archaeon]|nr:hypothetical protein [Candidatus Heimdallarchaeota archaeon]MCK5049343.1 hypothetical protein [Candidatus Heimdallarchaeota archaeon]